MLIDDYLVILLVGTGVPIVSSNLFNGAVKITPFPDGANTHFDILGAMYCLSDHVVANPWSLNIAGSIGKQKLNDRLSEILESMVVRGVNHHVVQPPDSNGNFRRPPGYSLEAANVAGLQNGGSI